MPLANYEAAVLALLADHPPMPETHYPGEYYCPTCTQQADDNRSYPCAVVREMSPYLPKRMVHAATRYKALRATLDENGEAR